MTWKSVATCVLLAAIGSSAPAVGAPPWQVNRGRVQQTSEEHMGKGYEYLQKERYQEAAAEFQAAIAANPALTRARYQLAVCQFALGHLEAARSEFKALSSDMPGDARLDYYLGRIDLVQGNAESAVSRLQAIAFRPPFSDTAYYLGSAYLSAGDVVNAEKWLKKAIVLNPRDFRVSDHLARVYQREKRARKAEEEYKISARLHHYYDERSSQALRCEQALDTKPLVQARAVCRALANRGDPDMLTLLGMLYGRHSDYEDALAPLAHAAALDPGSWEVQHNLGLTYFRLRRYREAADALQSAVSMRPDYFGTNALLGASLYALKEDGPAFRFLGHAHQLNPGDANTSQLLFNESFLLATQAFHARDYTGCLRFLKVALALQPDNKDVRKRLDEVERLQASAPEKDSQP